MLQTNHGERPLITIDTFGVNVDIKLMIVESGDMKLMTDLPSFKKHW